MPMTRSKSMKGADYRRRIVPAVALAGAAAASMTARQVAAENPPGLVVMVYPLKFVSADDAHRQVAEIFGSTEAFEKDVTLATDPRTNALICRAPAACHTEIAQLLQRLDVVTSAGGANHLAYPLKHCQAEQVAAVLEEVRSERLRIAYDATANMVVLQGPDAEILAARQLLAELDVAGPARPEDRSFLITVDFLRA